MPLAQLPYDILDSYAWMRRKVLGIEDQSLPTIHKPPYGVNETIALRMGKGWVTELAEEGTKPRMRMVGIADHTLLIGAIRWVEGTDRRAVLLPTGVAPLENYTFITHREDGTEIVITVGSDGYVRIPTGNTSVVNLTLKYPTPRDGG